jgi:hypothetical protein
VSGVLRPVAPLPVASARKSLVRVGPRGALVVWETTDPRPYGCAIGSCPARVDGPGLHCERHGGRAARATPLPHPTVVRAAAVDALRDGRHVADVVRDTGASETTLRRWARGAGLTIVAGRVAR